MRSWGDSAETSIPSAKSKEAEANQGAVQLEQPPEQVGAPLVADPEAAATGQPSAAAFHYPAVPPQPFARLAPAAGNGVGPGAWRSGATP